MGQYFKVVNHAKKEYLEPFNMRSSAKFPYLDTAIGELRKNSFWLEKLGLLMMIAEPPEQLGYKLQSVYPKGWEKEFAKLCQNKGK